MSMFWKQSVFKVVHFVEWHRTSAHHHSAKVRRKIKVFVLFNVSVHVVVGCSEECVREARLKQVHCQEW